LAYRALARLAVDGAGAALAGAMSRPGRGLDRARLPVNDRELIKLDPELRTARAREMFPLRKTEFRSKLDEALRAAGLPE
jgi:hypothetical protein